MHNDGHCILAEIPMKFVVLFEDNSGVGSDIRKSNMPQHLQFLSDHSEQIDAAGPLSNTDGSGAGGIWIVEAVSESDVTDLVEKDPFWPTGLRKSVKVMNWAQVFANGKALISP